MERLIADRVGSDSSGVMIPEYLVKWQGLSYAEATWYDKFKLPLLRACCRRNLYFGTRFSFTECYVVFNFHEYWIVFHEYLMYRNSTFRKYEHNCICGSNFSCSALLFLRFCSRNRMLITVIVLYTREKEVDIAFAQDAINEYKVAHWFLCALYSLISCFSYISL